MKKDDDFDVWLGMFFFNSFSTWKSTFFPASLGPGHFQGLGLQHSYSLVVAKPISSIELQEM